MLQDRWEGEDEEDVKENWWDEDEPEPEKETVTVVKKKTLQEKIAEKERLAKLKKEEKLKEKELKNKILTPEEKLIDKLEQVKLQLESDLTLAKDAFGGGNNNNVNNNTNLESNLDAIQLNDKASFDLFKKLLITKLNSVNSSVHYVNFLEDLFRDLCVTLDVDDLKKMSSNLTTLYNEKLKLQRNTSNKKKKVKGTSIKMEKNSSFYTKNLENNYTDDDYDDFL